MKLKGVNPIEQHIEKIVLGVVLLILLGVIALQFVTKPNHIEDAGRSIAPDQVYTALEVQANQLQSQLTDLEPELPDVQSVDLVERYNEAFQSAGGGRTQLSSALGEGVDVTIAAGGGAIDIPQAGESTVAALQVPATSTPIAASQWATLDPYALLEVPAYADFVPQEQPYDFPSVTVEATFSGTDLQAALTGSNGGAAIPRRYWSATGLAVLGLEAQRQRLMPDGSWGDSEPIATPPRTPTPTAAIGPEAGLLDLTELVSNAAGAVDEVVRPMFPPTIAGMEWAPPSERVATGDDSQSSRVRRVQRQLDRARAELERLNAAPRPGGGKTAPTTTRPGTGTNPDRVTALRERIEQLEQELADLGVDTDDAAPARRTQTSRTDTRSVLEEDSIDLWTHDLGVEPGETYRYRTRVVVNNPLFRKGAELDPDDADQQALTRDPFARGSWSEWSTPVVAGAREYYFVTGADTADQAASSASPKATVELYQMYYGHYRRSTLSVSPGDELAATLRVSGDLLRFDTGQIELADAAAAVAALGEGAGTSTPAGISRLPNRVTIDLGVYLLDVYTGLGSVESALGQRLTPMRVVLRDADGRVVVRSDLDDRSSQAYTLASESASAATSTPIRAPGAPAISPAADLFAPFEP